MRAFAALSAAPVMQFFRSSLSPAICRVRCGNNYGWVNGGNSECCWIKVGLAVTRDYQPAVEDGVAGCGLTDADMLMVMLILLRPDLDLAWTPHRTSPTNDHHQVYGLSCQRLAFAPLFELF